MNMINIKNVLLAICSLLFLMVGADKFLAFLEPPCSLMDRIPTIIWSVLGVIQLAAGILIWLPQFRKYVVGFFTVFMLVFSLVHLIQGTQDIGGSISMAILLGILLMDPIFIQGKNK